jgi:nucleoid-associated protein YgaU
VYRSVPTVRPQPRAVLVTKPVRRHPEPVAYIETRPLPRAQKTHVVQHGESLWSIANAVLGGDATPAQIAREVHKLWTLNRARIGTGDPDLVMAGTRLVLR